MTKIVGKILTKLKILKKKYITEIKAIKCNFGCPHHTVRLDGLGTAKVNSPRRMS